MSSRDRRATPRHVPLYSRAFVAWEEPEGPRFVNARLSDLSSGGAGILIQAELPADAPVWIGLEGTAMRDWARAGVVRVVPVELGMCRVGLKFAAPCPLVLFKRAIWGGSPMEGVARTEEPRPRPTNPRSCWTLRTSRSTGLILAADRLVEADADELICVPV